jgi:hypothetical protein
MLSLPRSLVRGLSTVAPGPVAGLPKVIKAMKAKAGDPYFKDVYRKFQLRVHPDLFTEYTELQAVNSASLQRLQGILNDARSKERTTAEKVVGRVEHLEFFLRATDAPKGSGPPQFLRVPITIRMPTTHCRHVLGDAMGQLFKHAGLPSRFHWGPEYWESTCVCASLISPPPSFFPLLLVCIHKD